MTPRDGSARPRRPWWRRVLRGLAFVGAALLVLVVVVVLGINTPWARRQLVERANAALADSFRGKLELTGVGRVGLTGVSEVDAVVLDAARRRVLTVHDLSVSIDLLPLVWDLAVTRPKDLVIDIDSVELTHAEVHLIDGGDGVPTLADAFTARTPGPPSQGTTTVHLARADFGHVWAHGSLGGTRIDADISALAGKLDVTADSVEIQLERAKLHARGLPAQVDPRGDLVGSLELPLNENKGVFVAQARFGGSAWGSPGEVSANLRGRSVSARVVFDAVSPAQLARVLPGSELRSPLALRATLTGTLDEPALSLRARIGKGEVDADLALNSRTRTLDASLHSRRLDLALIDPGLPHSVLSTTLTAAGSYSETQELSLRYRVGLSESEIQASPIPPIEGDGSFELRRPGPDAPVAWEAKGELRIAEPGAATALDYAASQQGGEPSVQVSAITTLADPPRLQSLVPGLRVQGRLQTNARFDAGSGRLRADAHASLPAVRTPTLSAQRVELRATADGALPHPELALDAGFARLAVAGRVYREGSVRIQGTPRQLRVDARTREAPHVQLGALVTLEPDVTVTDAALRVGSGDEVLNVSAASLRFGQQGIVGRDVRLATASGWARASFEYGGGLRTLRVEARDLDIQETAVPLQLQRDVPRGVVTADARFDRETAGPSGHLEASVEGLGYGSVKNATARVSARLRRGLLAGSAETRWRDSVAGVTIDELPLAALPPSGAKELAGRLTGHANMNLEDLDPLLRLGVLPLEEARGHAELEFQLEKRARHPARLEATLETSRLRLVGLREELEASTPQGARRAAPWSLTGVDVDLALALDQATRELSLDATLADKQGKLAMLQTDARWPEAAASLPLAEWPSLWQRVETTLHLWLLPRKLSEWPAAVAVSSLDGTASLSVHARGTTLDPSVRWFGRLHSFGPPDQEPLGLDLTTSGDYRPEGGTARLGVAAKDRQVVQLAADWRGDAIGYVRGGRSIPNARLHGRLDRFPMAVVPLVTSQRLAGHVSGDFAVEQGEGDWRARVALDSNDFSVARIAADRMRVRGNLKDGRFEASVRAKGKALGSLDAEVSGWAPMAANARGGSQLRAKLRANDFQLKSLEPLVVGSVTGLEGLMDAELEGELSGDAPTLRGHVEVSGGAAQLPAIGQTLHSIEARVKLDKNRIALNRFDARGLTGRLRARGSAVLDGLAVRSAEASVAITERDKIPLTVQGVTLGDAWGRASVRYRPVDERRQRLDVNVASFNLELPDVSPPGVQSLDPAAHIEVGHRTRAGKFVEIPLQPIEREPSGEPNRWIIAVQLGAVEITKGPGIEVGLTGNLRARVGRKTRLTGRIDLTGGKLDVRGKEFKIERGALTFDRSEVEEGVVTATARWDSPSDYTVYAEYSGTVKEGQLTLRSEPPLTQDEVLGLVMFGTPGGTFGARKQDEAATAVGVAGGTVTKGLNRALSEFTALDLSTRVDTSTGESRPELVLQVTPSVTARVTQAIGEPPPGQSPDRTFLTVDLRLFRRWSLSAQVGDEGGSSLDLIWRHRY